jgi:hypothetical protein
VRVQYRNSAFASDWSEECLIVINVSRKDRLTLSISVAVGSTIVSRPNVIESSRGLTIRKTNPANCPLRNSVSKIVIRNGHVILMPFLLYSFMVILGWIFEKPLPLLFDPFESVVSFHRPLMALVIFIIRAQVLYISGMVHIIHASGHRSLSRSPSHELRCGRRKIQLAGRRNTHLSVSLSNFSKLLI